VNDKRSLKSAPGRSLQSSRRCWVSK
jgi:hypothetical protein